MSKRLRRSSSRWRWTIRRKKRNGRGRGAQVVGQPQEQHTNPTTTSDVQKANHAYNHQHGQMTLLSHSRPLSL